MIRKTGYYWVLNGGHGWIIGYWNNIAEYFTFCGDEHRYIDYDFEEVDEIEITHNE